MPVRLKYLFLLKRAIWSVALVCFLVAALPLPRASALTVGEEKELGEKLLSLVRKEFRLLDDPDIAQYINGLGKEILTSAGPQFFNYHFFVINNKEFNAFAAPSGLIFINSGLIETTDTEGELYSVMAHEVGHAASRHYAERLSKTKKLNIGTTALMLAGLAMGAGPLAEALVTGSMATGATLGLQFSRQDEEEADRLAYKWMQADDRNPEAMADMLQKMRKISRYRSGRVPPYLLTHPEPEARLIYIEDRLHSESHGKYKPTDEFTFQRIKYRLLTLTREPQTLLPLFLRRVADKDKDKDDLKNFMAHYGLSQVYLLNRDYVKARRELQQVITRYPDRPILLTDLGIISFEAGQHAKALELFNTAAERDPDNAYTLFQQARALQQAGQLTKALALYNRLLGMVPDFSRLQYRIGQIMAAQGDQAAGHYHLGVYYWDEGDVKTARFHLREAMKGLPDGHRIKQKARELLDTIARLEKL